MMQWASFSAKKQFHSPNVSCINYPEVHEINLSYPTNFLPIPRFNATVLSHHSSPLVSCILRFFRRHSPNLISVQMMITTRAGSFLHKKILARELLDMMSASEGGGGYGKADVVREVALILSHKSDPNADKGGEQGRRSTNQKILWTSW